MYYIFDWYSVDILDKACIIAIAKDVNSAICVLKISYYKPYCYIRGNTFAMCSTNDITMSNMYDRKTFSSFRELRMYKRTHTTYMADEDDVCLFLATYNLDYNGWVSIEGHPTSSQISKYPEYELSSITKIVETFPLPSFVIASFDIEVYSSTKGMPQSFIHDDKIFMISIVTNDDRTVMIMENDERLLLERFTRELIDLDPDIITGFNIFNFDLRYIYDRLELYLGEFGEMSRINSIPTIHQKISWTNASYGSYEYTKPTIPGRMFIDMFQYFKRLNIDRYSLQYISLRFLGEGKNDMSNDEMKRLYKLGLMDDIAKYCIQDSALVIRLCHKFDVVVDFMERSKIMKCRLEDILIRGEQHKINHQLIFECIKRNVILKATDSDDFDGYQGATVFDPIPGLYNNCAILDYQSLYPSIIIANNICPSTYVATVSTQISVDNTIYSSVEIGKYQHVFRREPSGILPGLLDHILQQRQLIKTMMKEESDNDIRNILDKRQNSLKIVANSVYGIMGAKYSKYMKHKYCAESISGFGRYYFEQLVAYIRSQNLNVIYGDTDSCMISYDATLSPTRCIEMSKELCIQYSKLLPRPMFLNYENFNDKILIIAKKKYIMIREGIISYKGVTTSKRGYCEYVKGIYENLLDMIFKDSSKLYIAKYIIECIDRLLDGHISYDKLIISKGAKPPNLYKGNVPQKLMLQRLIEEGEEVYVGIRLEYVFVKNSSKLQGDKMFRVDEVRKKGLEVDYEYYVRYQLMNTIDQLLSFAGITDLIKTYVASRRIVRNS